MNKKTWKTVAYFYREVWKEKPAYIVFLLFAILLMAMLPFINILFPRYVIDELLGQRRVEVLAKLVVAMVILNWALQGLITVFERENYKLDHWFEQYFDKKFVLRSMEMDFEHTENPEVLNQSNKARDGMGWYSGGLLGLSNCFKEIVASFITLLGVMVIIAGASPLLFIIALLSVAGGSYIVSKMNGLEIATFNKGPQINRAFWYIHDILGETRYGKDIRLYGAKRMLTRKGEESFRGLYHLFKELEDGKRKWGCLSAVIAMCESIGIYLYLGYLAVMEKITVGQFTMLITSAIAFRTGLQNMITQLQELEKKTGFMGEYIAFMEYKDAMVKGHRKVPDMSHPRIEFKNVSFCYPRTEQYVLKNIDLTIEPGEHLSVVGLNGAGKTTFIKLLCRMYDVTEGEILVNGVNIQEYEYDQYMKLLSVVFQDFKLFSMSIRDNLRMGNWEKEAEYLEELCEMSGIKEKVDSLPNGLDTLIFKYFDEEGIEPSGGEQQKIAIARAIYKDAPVVVLDEPTAALDPVAEYEIYKQFDRLVGGKTAVYISHRLSSCKFCDKIAVFAEHTLAEYGTHDELVKRPEGIYAEMFRAQAQYYV